MTQNRHWRRTQSIPHSWVTVHADDWTLVVENGEHLARIFDTGDPVLLGSWRWWIRPFHMIDNIGSAQSGAEAKKIVEGRLTGALSSQTQHVDLKEC